MNTTEVENYPGFVEGVMGPDLMTRMQEQAERLGTDIRYEDVTSLDLDGEIKRVTTDDAIYETRTVIISRISTSAWRWATLRPRTSSPESHSRSRGRAGRRAAEAP